MADKYRKLLKKIWETVEMGKDDYGYLVKGDGYQACFYKSGSGIWYASLNHPTGDAPEIFDALIALNELEENK